MQDGFGRNIVIPGEKTSPSAAASGKRETQTAYFVCENEKGQDTRP